MRALWTLILIGQIAGFAGCRRAVTNAAPGPLARELFSTARQAAESLELALPPRDGAREQLSALIERARPLRQHADSPLVVERLNELLFTRLGFRRLVDDPPVESMLLPNVLHDRRGSCVGLGTLYLALGEALNLPLHGVLVPNHFFVRYERAGTQRNIELLRRGEQMPLSWYRKKYAVPPDNPLYLRNLSARESVAVLRFNLANTYRERGALGRARALYESVAQQLPDFAEAHANLGLTFQLLNDYPRAKRAYLRARRANPQLPGLEHNLKQLETNLDRIE